VRINQSPNLNTNPNSKSPNFTAAWEVRVFINGDRSIRTSNIRRGLREAQHILTNPANGDEKLKAIKSTVLTHVKDLQYYGGKTTNIGEIIRNIVHEKQGVGYLFTGPQATKLNELGKLIGPEKHAGLEVLGSTTTFESKVAVKNYFAKVEDFINNRVIRVKESINPDTGLYQGDEMILNLYTTSIGEPGTKGFKLNIDSAVWEKANQPPAKAGVKPEAKPLVLIKRARRTNSKVDNSQPRLEFEKA